jgi:hypothetical protein
MEPHPQPPLPENGNIPAWPNQNENGLMAEAR